LLFVKNIGSEIFRPFSGHREKRKMETFVPRGNVHGPILPDFVLKKQITFGAKVMYALLCDYASKDDHCWPAQATLAERLSCSLSSVKNYLTELVREKLIAVRREQYRSCVYYLIPPDDASNVQDANPDRQQPEVDRTQPKVGYLNTLKNQEERKDPPLPPVRDNPAPCPVPRHRPVGGVDSFSHDFEKAWEIYPKKEAMGLARSAWINLRRNRLLPPLEEILASIRRFTTTESWQRAQGQYVPQMGNWLRGQRWLDALPPADEQNLQEKEAVQALQREEEARKARYREESERLRPFYDAFAAKFTGQRNVHSEAMAFGTWKYLYSRFNGPSAADVPDDNALDIIAFLNSFKRRCEENAYKAKHVSHEATRNRSDLRRYADDQMKSPVNCGEILRTSGFLKRMLPQREALCAAI
jgi:hypothetical protein